MRLIDAFALSLILVTAPVCASAMSCELAELMNHPAVRDNAAFWQEFGSHGDINDETLRNLFRKYDVDSPVVERRVVARAEATTQASASGPRFTLAKQAIKDSRSLRPALKKDLDEFLTYAKEGVGGLQRELRRNPGKWNYKQLTGRFGSDIHSARLDDGYRVVFRQNEDGLVEILNIDNSTTH